MNTTMIITTIAPALIMIIVYIIVRFFPASTDSIDKSFISKAPQWWARDQKTWNTAHYYLAKKYFIYAIILTIFCVGMIFITWEYASILGYILLIVFILLANYQVRAYMQDHIK